MFRRDVQSIKDLVMRSLRVQGLETPLLQKRLIDAWPIVVGESIASYSENLNVYNQTLYVHMTMPSLRAELSMRRQEFVKKLNDYVGAQIITDICFR